MSASAGVLNATGDDSHGASGGGGSSSEQKLETSVCKWVRYKDHKRGQPQSPRTAEQIVLRHGCPRGIFLEYLQGECEEAEACFSLPFTLLLVISFAMVALLHDSSTDIRSVEDSLESDILENANFAFVGSYIGHKNLDDVNSIADFWSWMANGFLPLVFIQDAQIHEGFPENSPAYGAALHDNPLPRGMWLNYNRIVGGIRFSQEVSGEDDPPCPSLESLTPFYGMSCVSGMKYELDPDMGIARRSSDPKRFLWMYTYEDLPALQDKVWEWEQDKWYNRTTLKIEIAVPCFNAEFGLHTLLYIDFFLSRGGHIWKRIIPMSTYADLYTKWEQVLADMIWGFCISYIFVMEVLEVGRVIHRAGFKGLLKEYVGFWNALDWFSMFFACSIVGMAMIAQTMTTEVNNLMAAIGNSATPDLDKKDVEAYITQLEETLHFVHRVRINLALYPVIIVLRLFKAYAAQPRLALVTNTLGSAWGDLMHFFLVFASVFISFAVMGCILFGQEVKSFGTWDRAIMASFRVLLGDLQWEDISRVGRPEAALWMFSFIVIVMLLLLNMILAIVMDHYGQAKDIARSGDTLWEEAYQIWTRLRMVQKGKAVPISKVVAALEAQEKEEAKDEDADSGSDDEEAEDKRPPMTISDIETIFRQHAPGVHRERDQLGPEQALEMMAAAVQDFYNKNHQSADMDEVMYLSRKVEWRTKKMSRMAKKYETRAEDEIESLKNLTKELALFTDELRDERQAQRQELEDLRAMKRGLLLQLQASQPEAEVLGIFPGSNNDSKKRPPKRAWRLTDSRRKPPPCLRLDRMSGGDPGEVPSAANAVPSIEPAWSSERGVDVMAIVPLDGSSDFGAPIPSLGAGVAGGELVPVAGSVRGRQGPGSGFGPALGGSSRPQLGRPGPDMGHGAGLDRSPPGSDYGANPSMSAQHGFSNFGAGNYGGAQTGPLPSGDSFGDSRYAPPRSNYSGSDYSRYSGDPRGGHGDPRGGYDPRGYDQPYNDSPTGGHPPLGSGYDGEDYGRREFGGHLDRGDSFGTGSAPSSYGPPGDQGPQGAYWGEGQLQRWDSAGYGFDEAPARYEADDRGYDPYGRGGARI